MIGEPVPRQGRPFRLGINYWPARTAMGWWPAFEPGEVEEEFARIAGAGFDSVRLFLTWEHFQPRPDQVDAPMLARLVTTLDLAREAGLGVMPTLFTGHMSGVNWIPRWALGGTERDPRFRVVCEGQAVPDGLRNWYSDPEIVEAQALMAREASKALARHPALWAWDLGNESSNCMIPASNTLGRDWLLRMADAIRSEDGEALITVGLHMEDLAEDRNIGPADAVEACDFLTMHGYPGYAPWARGPTDAALLGFLAELTRWLSGGAEVLFSELGAPTFRAGDAEGERSRALSSTALLEEQEAAAYIERSLEVTLGSGCTGAMLWCHADYVPAMWTAPPLDEAVHERFFGQWRSDGSPKPAVAAVAAFAKERPFQRAASADNSWIDIEPREFYENGESDLPRLYQRYCAHADAKRE